MSCSIFFTMMLSMFSSPTNLPLNQMAGLSLTLPPAMYSNQGIGRGRSMAKMGTGRGMNGNNHGRGMAKVGTGRAMSKTGSDRGFAKMGTGRGMGKMGTGRGFAPLGNRRGFHKVSPPSIENENGSSEQNADANDTRGGSRQIRRHLVDLGGHVVEPATKSESDAPDARAEHRGNGVSLSQPEGNIASTPMRIEEQSGDGGAPMTSIASEQPKRKPANNSWNRIYSQDIQSYMKRGRALVDKKAYLQASRYYSMAQQIEGLKGPASLKMAAIRVAMGRYYEGINDLRNFLDGGGKITPKGIGLDQDDRLEKRLDEQVRFNPFNGNILTSAILYSINRSNKEKASHYLDLLIEMDPRNPCIEGLRHAIDSLP